MQKHKQHCVHRSQHHDRLPTNTQLSYYWGVIQKSPIFDSWKIFYLFFESLFSSFYLSQFHLIWCKILFRLCIYYQLRLKRDILVGKTNDLLCYCSLEGGKTILFLFHVVITEGLRGGAWQPFLRPLHPLPVIQTVSLDKSPPPGHFQFDMNSIP